MTSTLNIILIKTYNFSHSKRRDLSRIIHNFLFFSILTKKEIREYFKVFQKFKFSSTWSRIQLSTFYIWSWSLFEIERVSILTFFIFKSEIKQTWFRYKFFQIVSRRLNNDVFVFNVTIIIWVYEIIVKCNIIVSFNDMKIQTLFTNKFWKINVVIKI